MNEKSLGYILIITGIITMAISVFSVYMVFTNQIKPFTVFSESIKTAKPDNSSDIQELINNPAGIAQMQKEIVTEVLEKQINKTMNMGATIFLMYFIMLFGFRISTLGVQLVRPVNVNLKASDNNKEGNINLKTVKE